MSKTTEANHCGIHGEKTGCRDTMFLKKNCVAVGWTKSRNLEQMYYSTSTQGQRGSMSIATAVVLSMFLLTMTGCAASSTPSPAKQEAGKKDSTVKPAKHDEEKAMNEESQNAIMHR